MVQPSRSPELLSLLSSLIYRLQVPFILPVKPAIVVISVAPPGVVSAAVRSAGAYVVLFTNVLVDKAVPPSAKAISRLVTLDVPPASEINQMT